MGCFQRVGACPMSGMKDDSVLGRLDNADVDEGSPFSGKTYSLIILLRIWRGIIAVVDAHNLLILLTNLMRSDRISDGGVFIFSPVRFFTVALFRWVHYVLYMVFSWIGSVWENWIFIPRSNIRFEGFAVFEMAHFSSQSKRVLYTLYGM